MIFSTLIMMPPRSAPFLFIPDWSRRGIGTLLLEACENAAKSAGFRRFEMGGDPHRCEAVPHPWLPTRKDLVVPLTNGESLPIIHMEKQA